MGKPIYLDNHATTRIDPRVLEAMMPYLREEYGNPASQSHSYGWNAAEAVEEARHQVALLIAADPNDIVFTGGATESNNMVLKGTGCAYILTSTVEHMSVLKPARVRMAWQELSVDRYGLVDVGDLLAATAPHRDLLVSIMAANNEVGTIQPLAELASSGPHEFLLHSDMAQVLGRVPVDVCALGLDFASFSAHKLYGPKGVGALYIAGHQRERLSKLLYGGSHEGGMRAGTLNVPGIVGFGQACEIARLEMKHEVERIQRLRDLLEERLKSSVPGMKIHGHPSLRLPGNLCVYLPCADMGAFIAAVEGDVALSTGSACSGFSGKSHVLNAMRVPAEEMASTVRFGVGRFNTEEEVERAANSVLRALDIANNGG